MAGDVDLAPSGDGFAVLSGTVLSGSVFDANALAVRALLSLAGSGAGTGAGTTTTDMEAVNCSVAGGGAVWSLPVWGLPVGIFLVSRHRWWRQQGG